MGKGNSTDFEWFFSIFYEKLRVFSGFLMVFTDYFLGVRRFCAPHFNREMAQINKAKSWEKGWKETHKPVNRPPSHQDTKNINHGLNRIFMDNRDRIEDSKIPRKWNRR